MRSAEEVAVSLRFEALECAPGDALQRPLRANHLPIQDIITRTVYHFRNRLFAPGAPRNQESFRKVYLRSLDVSI
jgi:hypothetical protein